MFSFLLTKTERCGVCGGCGYKTSCHGLETENYTTCGNCHPKRKIETTYHPNLIHTIAGSGKQLIVKD